MAQSTNSDLTPFHYEPLRRTDRIAERPDEKEIAQQRADELRLLRSPGNSRDNVLSQLAQEWCERLSHQIQAANVHQT